MQYRQGLLAGRDTLYLATRQYIEESNSDVERPTKRQVNAWLKGEKGFQRQKTQHQRRELRRSVATIAGYIQKRSADGRYMAGTAGV